MTKAELNREIAKHGFELVRNTLGGSYFYWAALPDAPALPDNVRSIYVYKFDDLTDAQWRAEVAAVLAAIAAQEA